MKQISSDFLKIAINEAINEMFGEAGPTGGMNAAPPRGGMNAAPPKGGMAAAPPKGGLAAAPPKGGLAGAKPVAAGQPAQDEDGKMKDGTYVPKVTYAYYEKWWEDENPNVQNGGKPEDDEEVLKVGLDYVFPQHQMPLIEKWNQEYPDIMTVQKIWNRVKGDTAAHIQFRIKPGKENDFLGIIDNLYNDIASLDGTAPVKDKATGDWKYPVPKKGVGKYSLNLFDKSKIKMADYVKKAPSKAEIEQIDFKAADTWRELLSNMQDKDTLKALSSIGGVVYTTTMTAKGIQEGNQISDRNKIEILRQRPDFAQRAAAGEKIFVTQAWYWRDHFNREIVDPSQKIVITKPTSRKPADKAAFEKAVLKCGWTSVDEFKQKEKSGDISSQERWAVYAMYNKLNPADTHFGPVIVYEYANTQLIPGKPDVFNDERGLADNIYNIPNDAAIRDNGAVVQQTDNGPAPGQARSDQELEEVSKIVASIVYNKTKSSVVDTGNPGDDVVDNVYKYAEFLALNINFAKPQYKEAYCQSLASAVAATLGFPTIKGASYLKQVLSNRGADMELKTMILLFMRKYQELMFEINEQWRKSVNKLKKAGRIQAPAQAKAVGGVNEEGIGGEATGTDEFKPLSIEQLGDVLGVPLEQIVNGEMDTENGYEVADAPQSTQSIQESFFNLLDRIELL